MIYWALPLIGLAAGLMGGLLGIGGSIIMIPAMTEVLGVHPHLFQAAALIVNFFIASPACVRHIKAGAVQWPVVRLLVPGAVAGSVLGVAASELSLFRGGNQAYLTGLFGAFLLLMAGREASRSVRERSTARNDTHDPPPRGQSPDADSHHREAQPAESSVSVVRAVLGVGLPTGFVSGLLGVGGGLVAVPLQCRICGIGLRRAIANSASMIVALSLVGASLKHVGIWLHHPSIDLAAPMKLAAVLIPTAMAGSWLGARMTHTLPLKVVRLAFVVLIVVAGGRMIWRAAQSL